MVALVHTEYPGNVYGNCSTGLHYPQCWTVTLGLAVSQNWGQTWEHARNPPHHLVAAVPYGYNETQLAYGWGDPSNIVKSPKDGYFYVSNVCGWHCIAFHCACSKQSPEPPLLTCMVVVCDWCAGCILEP